MYLHGAWISVCSVFHGTDCPCLSLFFRLGEVTLRDFKAAVDRHGSYRYHFKALDPEFGTVKEEVGVGESRDYPYTYSHIHDFISTGGQFQQRAAKSI